VVRLHPHLLLLPYEHQLPIMCQLLLDQLLSSQLLRLPLLLRQQVLVLLSQLLLVVAYPILLQVRIQEKVRLLPVGRVGLVQARMNCAGASWRSPTGLGRGASRTRELLHLRAHRTDPARLPQGCRRLREAANLGARMGRSEQQLCRTALAVL
jgi:hypothetical protein